MSAARITDQATPLLVRDVAASIAYWTDRVGFRATGVWGEPPDFAILERDGAFVMLGAAPGGHEIVPYWRIRPHLWNAYFWVDDAAALFAEMQERGATIDYELCLQPYGVREFGIQDLDGHDIGFGEIVRDRGP